MMPLSSTFSVASMQECRLGRMYVPSHGERVVGAEQVRLARRWVVTTEVHGGIQRFELAAMPPTAAASEEAASVYLGECAALLWLKLLSHPAADRNARHRVTS